MNRRDWVLLAVFIALEVAFAGLATYELTTVVLPFDWGAA